MTEAGDGEDGRIKSAIGIGSLLQRRHRRHHPRFAHRGQRARDPRGAGAGRALQRRRRPGRAPGGGCAAFLRSLFLLAPRSETIAETSVAEPGRRLAGRRGTGARAIRREAVRRRSPTRSRAWAITSRRSSPRDAELREIDPRDDAAIAALECRAGRDARHRARWPRSPGDRRLPPARREARPAPSDPAQGHARPRPPSRGRFPESAPDRGHAHRLAALRRHRRRHPRPGRTAPGQSCG